MTDLERALAAALSTSSGCPCPDDCTCGAAVEERRRAAERQTWRDLDDAKRTAQQLRTGSEGTR